MIMDESPVPSSSNGQENTDKSEKKETNGSSITPNQDVKSKEQDSNNHNKNSELSHNSAEKHGSSTEQDSVPEEHTSTEEKQTVVDDTICSTDKESGPPIEEQEQTSATNNNTVETNISSKSLETENPNLVEAVENPAQPDPPDTANILENEGTKEPENVVETTSDSQPSAAGLQDLPPVPEDNEKHEKTSEVDSSNVDPLHGISDSEQSLATRDEESVKMVRFSEQVEEIIPENLPPIKGTSKEVKSVRFAEDDSKMVTSDCHTEIQSSKDYTSYDESDFDGEEDNDDADKEEVEEEEDLEYDESRSESGESTAGSLVPQERESGDGQESEKKEKKLDHDEDKRDPQYIPKKGNFYEHDDRTSETDEQPEVKKKAAPPPKPVEAKERWKHDKYDEDLQTPKTKEELIDQYGYNIRDEEGPPKARRRRRYGRGPNKYTRSWEEEDAYNKVRGVWRSRGGGGRGRNNVLPKDNEEEFPTLAGSSSGSGKKFSVQNRLKKYENKEDKQEIEKHDPPPKTPPITRRERDVRSNNVDAATDNVKKESSAPLPPGRKNFKKVIAEEQAAMAASSSSFARGRGRGRGRGIGSSRSFTSSAQQHPKKNNSSADDDIAALSQHFSDAVINVDNKSIMPVSQNTRASSLPPTSASPSAEKQAAGSQATPNPTSSSATNEQKEATPVEKSEGKSKRYSTQRQRSVPGMQQPVHQQQAQQQQAPPAQRFIPPAEQFFHQGNAAAPAQYSQPPPPPPAQFTPEVPLLTFIPPAGQFPPPIYVPPPPYLPPAPMPVQVSVRPQQAPPPRPEVYQGASGITYYNTQAQVTRPVSTSRRVKLAIPIVAPPEST